MPDIRKPLVEGYSQNEARYLLEKWATNVEAVRQVNNGLEDYSALALARCLETTDRALSQAQIMLGETVQPTDLGGFGDTSSVQLKRFYFDIITATLPNMISQELVSVQPIAQRIAQIFFLRYIYANSKGKVAAGDEMLDARRGWASGHRPDTNPATTYDNQSVMDYGSEYITGETLGAAGNAVSGTLAWKPVRPGTISVAVTISGTAYVIKDTDGGSGTGELKGYNADGTAADILATADSTHNFVNYSDGTFQIGLKGVTTSTTGFVGNYRYNNEQAPASVPEITLKVDSTVVQAESRKLKALYSFDAAFDLRMQHGLDIDDTLQSGISNELINELDAQVCQDLLTNAALSITWNRVPASNIQYEFHKNTFRDQLVAGSNKIFQKTLRSVGNFIVAGYQAASIIESMGAPHFVAAGNTKTQGPHFCGTLDGKFKVYKNPYYPADKFVVGYKGDNFLEAGYIFAPYLPIFATQLIMAEDFQGRRGFATSNGRLMVNNLLYVKGTITSNTTNTVEIDPQF